MRRERAREPASAASAPMAPWRLFWRMSRYRPWLYAVDTLLVIAGTVLFLVPGLIARAVFDTLAGQTPGWSVGLGIYGLIVLLVGTQVARMAINVLTILVDLTVRHSLHGLQRKNLMRRLLELPAASALPVAPGEAINRFRDDAGETALFLAWIGLLNVVGMVAFAAVALVVMLRIDAAITFAVFLPLAVVIAVAEAAGRRVERYRSASREAAGRVSAFLGETVGAVLSIQVAGAEERMVEQLRLRNEQRLRQVLRERLFGEGLRSVFSSTVHLGTGGILLLAGNAMRTGSFTVGDFALFIYVLTWVTALTQSFGALLARYQQTRVSFDRLAVLLQGAPPERLVEPVPIFLHRPAPAAPYTPKLPAHRLETLHAVGLTYRFPSSRRGIVDMNLHLARGTFTVITGPVGAGKTTLLRVLLGLLPRDAGEILWNGAVVADATSFLVPPRCAYTPQAPRLLSATIRENVLMGLPEAEADLPRALHLAVLERDLAAMPDGLDTVVGPRGVRLSGGQMQRTAAARMFVRQPALHKNCPIGPGLATAVACVQIGGPAVYRLLPDICAKPRQPELLVFDDLSSALDVETERALWDRLLGPSKEPGVRAERVPHEVTCLAVSHRRTALERADRIVVLDRGSVEATGTLSELLRRSDTLRRLWEERQTPDPL